MLIKFVAVENCADAVIRTCHSFIQETEQWILFDDYGRLDIKVEWALNCRLWRSERMSAKSDPKRTRSSNGHRQLGRVEQRPTDNIDSFLTIAYLYISKLKSKCRTSLLFTIKVDWTNIYSPESGCWMMAILPQIIIQLANCHPSVDIIDSGSDKIQFGDLRR